MHLQASPYAVFVLVTAAIGFTVTILSWRRRDLPGGYTFSLLTLCITIYTFCAGMEAAAIGANTKILWSKLEYIGIAPVSTLLLVFILVYTHQDKHLTRPVMALLFSIPLLIILVVWTNEWHSLFWTGFTPISGTNNLKYHHGPLFFICIAYMYALILLLLIMLARRMIRVHSIYRSQIGFLFASSLFPLLSSIVYILEIPYFKGVDTTPLGFMLTNLGIYWTITHLGLFRIVPVARDTIIENLPDGVIVLDSHNYVADMNPAARTLFSFGKDPPFGQSAQEVFKDYLSIVKHISMEDHQSVILENRSATMANMELRISPIINNEGKLLGKVILARDISRQVAVEKSLRESEARLRRITDNMLDVITETDPQGCITYVSPSIEQVLGYTVDEMLGKPLTEFIIPEERQSIFSLVKTDYATVKSGASPIFRYEYRSRHKNGNIIWVESIAHFMMSEDNHFVTAIAVNRDITDRKRAEEANRQTQDLLNLVIDGVPALIGYLDREERYLFVNRAYSEWYGHDRDYFIGKKASEVLSPKTYQSLVPHYREVFRGNRAVLETEVVDKDGHKRMVKVILEPHFDDERVVKAIFVLVQDITELKETEETLRGTVMELESFNQTLVGRELRMIELKEEVNALLTSIQKAPKYPIPH